MCSGDNLIREATKNSRIEGSMVKDVPQRAKAHLARLSKIAKTIAGQRKSNDPVEDTFPLVVDAEDQIKSMIPALTDPLQHDVVADMLLPWVHALNR